mgnify:CR=1 FL=1
MGDTLEPEKLQSDPLNDTPLIKQVEARLGEKFPYFAKVIRKRINDFGPRWCDDFEQELSTFFQDRTPELNAATDGYGMFSLDGLKLQKKFDKTLQYQFKSYEECKDEVYLNRDYMFSLYLPGILMSHFLWPHHYNQLLWFRDFFIPLIANEKTFYDVGVGTGFYSKETLRALPSIRGTGMDISPLSLEHDQLMVKRWGFDARYRIEVRDVVTTPPTDVADCLINVEVLEHLEDPGNFLKSLRKLVKTGGYAFITAAIDAPNKDHIYLYRNLDSIEIQLREAAFKVVDRRNFPGFEKTKLEETVPQNGAFICRAE